MAQPTIWPKKTFFYPVGNTTPCCFTQDLSPEQDAKLLLLACGDPRSILYTTYADLATCKRKLDFTCADWQPGVLARNILLFSMIVDGVDSSTIFAVFYNFFLNSKALRALVSQCELLARLSVDDETWKSSKYGGILRFSTRHAMEDVRHYWLRYKETAELPKVAKEQLKSTFLAAMKSEMEEHGNSSSLAIATGPLVASFLDDKAAQNLCSLKELWTTGVVSSRLFKDAVRNLLNPTFVHSIDGDSFDVHYATDPLKSFYLSPALASTKQQSVPASTLADYTKTCLSQFGDWCSAFKNRFDSSPDTIVIRIFVGEALALCRALRYCKDMGEVESGAYIYPWGGRQIALDAQDYGSSGSAPSSFDIIDTSNLSDHCALLNLLVVTIPLLRQVPSSVIHTHTLHNVLPSEPGKPSSSLLKNACADIPTLSLMLGVAPTSYTSHFTTNSNRHTLLIASSGQFSEAISWKFTNSIISGPSQATDVLKPGLLVIEPATLSQLLLSIYHQMFAEEDQQRNLANPSAMNLRKQEFVLYQRSSLISVFQLIKARVQTDWDRAMQSFMDLVARDRTFLMGLHSFQELACQLHLQGLYTMDILQPAALDGAQTQTNRLSRWHTVPPVVCVVLKVPREALAFIESLPLKQIGTPILQCESSGSSFHNIHPSFQPIFGNIKLSRQDGEDQIDIIEDVEGFKGDSDLIVTFYIPAMWIVTEPSMVIGLHIHTTPLTIHLVPKFGMRLTLFSTSLKDTKQVFVVRQRPGNPHEQARLKSLPRFRSEGSVLTSQVTLGFDATNTRIINVTMRDCITDPAEVASLKGGAAVQTRQVSDCGILVTFEGYRRVFTFPYPLLGNACKTRIARKSAYIEIECPIRPDFLDSKNLSSNLFPVPRSDRSLSLVNVHYLNMNVLPVLHLAVPKSKLQWVSTFLGMTFSKQERALNHVDDPVAKGTLVNLKETIMSLFLSSTGLRDHAPYQRPRVVGLASPTPGIKTYTLMFINDVKLDLAGQTIVLDACVVPLTDPLVDKIAPLLSRLTKDDLMNLPTLDDEVRLWRQLLVVAAERCRTWHHTPNCEYLSEGIPRILDGVEKSPLCSCGKGKNLGSFGENRKWAMVHKEATRIAISPLVTTSPIGESFDQLAGSSEETRPGLTIPSRSFVSSVSQLGSGNPERCAKCAKADIALQACSVCKVTKYCSRDCQRGHWKVHKPLCNSFTS